MPKLNFKNKIIIVAIGIALFGFTGSVCAETTDPTTTTPEQTITTSTISPDPTSTSTDDNTLTTTTSDNITSTSTTPTSTDQNTVVATTTTDTTSTTTATSTNQNTTTTTTNNTGGASETQTNVPISVEKINDVVDKLINFLKSKQQTDGKISDSGISDWSAMAFGSKEIYSDTIKNGTTDLKDYIYNFTITSTTDSNTCAGYPRHILALLASGVAKTDIKITDLKNKINDTCIVDGAFGEYGINDDIFGLLAMLSLDETLNSATVQSTLNGIISNQNQTSGAFISWGSPSPDITGASINALKYAQSKGINIDENIFIKAKQYLKSSQLSDGGWCYDVAWCNNTSDALTTSWVTMGINALNEKQNDWFNIAGKNPWYILTNLDGVDHYNSAWSSDGVDWFATKHAIPALLEKTWPIILEPKTIINDDQKPGGGPDYKPTATTTLIVTSTIISTTTLITTTTIEATTTPIIIPTTTPKITIIISTTTPTTTTQIIATSNKNIYQIKKIPPSLPEENITKSEPAVKDKNQIIDNLPLDTPTKKTAKRILAISGGSALVVGLYLGLRLLRNVI
ncbi:MAG: prenyltransferase/squalene oxidase repeat-containing protein [Candidatus Magasanikbacteria bacterium]